MILSNRELHVALDEKRIIITPEPEPRTPRVAGAHCPYDTHSVDLTLGSEISIPKDPGCVTVDLSRPGNVAKHIQNNSKGYEISEEQPFTLKPNIFILAKTLETISLPIIEGSDTCLAARIEGKSSRARFGVLVHFTAPTVHPGFNGTLTLEMINLGPSEFTLRPGMAIAQLIVEEVKGCPYSNPSQFQGQTTAAGLVVNGKSGS